MIVIHHSFLWEHRLSAFPPPFLSTFNCLCSTHFRRFQQINLSSIGILDYIYFCLDLRLSKIVRISSYRGTILSQFSLNLTIIILTPPLCPSNFFFLIKKEVYDYKCYICYMFVEIVKLSLF